MPKSSRKLQSGCIKQPLNSILTGNFQDIYSWKQPQPVTLNVNTVHGIEFPSIWTSDYSKWLSTRLVNMELDLSPSISLASHSFTLEYLTLLISSNKKIEGILFSSQPMELCSTDTQTISSNSKSIKLSGLGGQNRNLISARLDGSKAIKILLSDSSKKPSRKKNLKGGRNGQTSK